MLDRLGRKKRDLDNAIVFVLTSVTVDFGTRYSFQQPRWQRCRITTIITTPLATKRLSLLYDLDPKIETLQFLLTRKRLPQTLESITKTRHQRSRTAIILFKKQAAAAKSITRFYFRR